MDYTERDYRNYPVFTDEDMQKLISSAIIETMRVALYTEFRQRIRQGRFSLEVQKNFLVTVCQSFNWKFCISGQKFMKTAILAYYG